MELFGNYSLNENTKVYKFIVTKISSFRCEQLRPYVMRVVGDHIDDLTNDNVETLSISDLELNRFPRCLNSFFPNLNSIVISSCGITNLSKGDFEGLQTLRNLHLNGNEISQLSDDLFDCVPNIEAISFYNNQIKSIGSKTFDKLKSLTYANFKMNRTIDACYKTTGSGVTLNELRGLIAIGNCVGKKSYSIEEVIQIYMETTRTIKV
jgi:Leucine rich repeat